MIQIFKKSIKSLFWSWSPGSDKEATQAIGFNFLLHWFPAKITDQSKSWGYSAWLGTITLVLFVILSITGVVLMFVYVPSIERAYHTIKDVEFVVSYGWFIRRMHRWAAHLMVAFVFLHMIRVFLTGAYKSSKKNVNANRPFNWIIGLILLLLTMLLSYTGYLLPWDQLALWAITIGANIALSVPIIGEQAQFLMQGGTIIDQNTLIIWYTLHIAVLPLVTTGLIAWHMWRIRKDGGLAVVENIPVEDIKEEPEKSKTYSLMGVTQGVRTTVLSHKIKDKTDLFVPTTLIRVTIVFLFTTAVVMFLSSYFTIPLEEPASLEWTPNPAKAPWYFLWLQELVTITTIRFGGITINGGLVGGVIIPGILVTLAMVWPYIDRSPDSAVGVWFHKVRARQNTIFLIIIIAIASLSFVGSVLRGPNWGIFMPWEAWPLHPSLI